jgi:hypothetical protein
MSPSKILAVDDEADFEALITQHFRPIVAALGIRSTARS